MLCKSFIALAVASLASAETPTGFTPGSKTGLIVAFNGKTALNGAVEARTGESSPSPDKLYLYRIMSLTTTPAVQQQPTIATTQRLNGTSYAVIMVDIDIPTNSPPATSTLLHWMQTDLKPATAATSLNSSAGGSASEFLLQNSSSNTAPFAVYNPPNPPARIPLSHRYVQILVDTSGAPASAIDALKSAAADRSGFSAEKTLTAAGLQNKVVAGNFFNVTNPGPAMSGNGSGNGTVTVNAAPAGQASQSLMGLVLFMAVSLSLAC